MSESIDVLNELDAGIFMRKFNESLKKAAVAALNHGKQSMVVIELKFDQIKNSRQVIVTHKVGNSIPHETGKSTDVDIKTTPMNVHSDGNVSIFSENQTQFQFNRTTTNEEA